MRTHEEMMKLILDKAINDERIRAVTMEGSRVSPNGDYTDIWEKLFLIYDFFAENAECVAGKLNFCFDSQETKRVRDFLSLREKQFLDDVDLNA